LNRYRNKISSPLLDRIDIQIELPRLENHELLSRREKTGESSEIVRARVTRAHSLQLERQGKLNAVLNNQQIEKFCQVGTEAENLLMNAIDKLRLTARSYHKILKLARTIADIDTAVHINTNHISEAIRYRQADRKRPQA
jgi:magnesium chelatase family protein